MLRPLYRWLYHYRQRQAARNRLQGKPKRMPTFRRFTNSAFERATFGKYDPRGFRRGRKAAVVYGLAALLLGWFIWESVTALGMFQPPN